MYGGQVFNSNFFHIFWQNIEKNGLARYITPITGMSSQVAKNWNKRIHLLYIDGSHEYEDVLADFQNFYPHVVPGGIVAFHDVHTALRGPIGFPGVQKVWQDVASVLLSEVDNCATLAFGRKK